MNVLTPDVHGHCAPGFEALRAALSEILATGAEVGAALAVYVDKHAVVDLWGGHADAARTRPWTADTIVNLYSIGKAVSAVCALRLVDAGVLDLDTPVSRYWPEFAQAGKAQLPVRFLLTHQAGLPAIGPALPAGAALQWNVMTEALAAQPPWWLPGARHGYHVNTQGFLLGEVIRRITGKTMGMPCSNGPRASGSDSSWRSPSGAWARTRARSGTSAPAVRSGLPIPMRESRSATR